MAGLATCGGYLADKLVPDTPLWVVGFGVGAASGIKFVNDLRSS